jgi:hypothetical protein
MQARALAEGFVNPTDKRPARLSDAPLPLVVSLPGLLRRIVRPDGRPPEDSEDARPTGQTDADYFRECLLDVAAGREESPARAYLWRHLTGPRMRLFLDGLDEVGSERLDVLALERLLAWLGGFAGRVVLGTRPYGLDGHQDVLRRLWPADALACRLAPLDEHQSANCTSCAWTGCWGPSGRPTGDRSWPRPRSGWSGGMPRPRLWRAGRS